VRTLVLNGLRISQFENAVRVIKDNVWRQTPCIYATLDYLLGEEGRDRGNARKPHRVINKVASKF